MNSKDLIERWENASVLERKRRASEAFGGPYVHDFASDLNLAHQLEEKVIEKVGARNWLRALEHVLSRKHHEHDTEVMVARATADQRCLACLLALGALNEQ